MDKRIQRKFTYNGQEYVFNTDTLEITNVALSDVYAELLKNGSDEKETQTEQKHIIVKDSDETIVFDETGEFENLKTDGNSISFFWDGEEYFFTNQQISVSPANS